MVVVPNLPETIFRPYHHDTDAEALYHIIHGCKDIDHIDPYSTLENLPTRETLQHDLVGTDPRNAIIAEINGQAVGYNRLIWWTESSGLTLYLHLGHVRPHFRVRGIGTALLSWSEARIRELAVEQGGAAMFGANASSTEIDATRLLLDHGYQPVFSLAQMEYLIPADLNPLPIPAGVEIRAPQPHDAEKMWQGRLNAYSEIPLVGASAPNESAIDELHTQIQMTGHLWRIAWVGDEIASGIWCSIADYEGSKSGRLNEVHTTPKFQRKGIGRVLMIHTFLMFKAMNVMRIRLHTLEDNRRGAKTFYETIGFKTLKTFPRYRKPL